MMHWSQKLSSEAEADRHEAVPYLVWIGGLRLVQISKADHVTTLPHPVWTRRYKWIHSSLLTCDWSHFLCVIPWLFDATPTQYCAMTIGTRYCRFPHYIPRFTKTNTSETADRMTFDLKLVHCKLLYCWFFFNPRLQIFRKRKKN